MATSAARATRRDRTHAVTRVTHRAGPRRAAGSARVRRPALGAARQADLSAPTTSHRLDRTQESPAVQGSAGLSAVKSTGSEPAGSFGPWYYAPRTARASGHRAGRSRVSSV